MPSDLEKAVLQKFDLWKDRDHYLHDPKLPEIVTFVHQSLPQLTRENPPTALEIAGACVRISRENPPLQEQSIDLWHYVLNRTTATYPLTTFTHLTAQATHPSSNKAAVRDTVGYWHNAVTDIFRSKPKHAVGISMHAVDLTEANLVRSKDRWKNILRNPDIKDVAEVKLKKISDFQKVAVNLCEKLTNDFLRNTPVEATALFLERYILPSGKNPYENVEGKDRIEHPTLRRIAVNCTLLWRKDVVRPESFPDVSKLSVVNSL